MYPDGNTWNSAVPVVMTAGPPSCTTALIFEGSECGSMDFCAGFSHPAVIARIPGIINKNAVAIRFGRQCVIVYLIFKPVGFPFHPALLCFCFEWFRVLAVTNCAGPSA